MYEQILFPTDGSEGAAVALEHLLDLATTHGARVHVVNVADTTRESLVQIRGNVIDALEEEGERIVTEAGDRARERGVPTVTDVLQGEPYSTIIGYADARDIDLIVMPTRGRRGLERLLLGSTTERVVRGTDVPVLTLRPDDDFSSTYPYRDVLVPTDGSDCARAALDEGVRVANGEGAALHLLSVIDVASLGVDVRTDIQTSLLEEGAREILDEAATHAESAGVEPAGETIEYGGSIHGAIRSYIDEHDIDLVVVGTHGRSGVDRYMLGSVTEKLVRTAPIPVLSVRDPRADSPSDSDGP